MSGASDDTLLARALAGLPLAVVIVGEDDRPVWANEVADSLTSDAEEDRARLLDAVADAVGVDHPAGASGLRVSKASLPTQRGLIERQVWTSTIGAGLRVAVFHPDAISFARDEETRRIEAMLAHTEDLITLLGADGTILASNAAAGRLTGFSGGGVNGRNAADFVHPDDLERVGATLAAVTATSGATTSATARLRFADGTWHDVEATVTNLLDEPSVASLVISMHDVTDRNRAQALVARSEARLRSVIENLTDVIVVLDEAFDITYASPGIESIIDAPADTNVGMSALNDIHPDDLPTVIETLTTLKSKPLGETTRVELRLEARPGTQRWRWIEATAVNRLADPHVHGLVCTLRDVTESKSAAAELQAAFDRLRELDTLKDQFLASVSHEMRTPLAIIIGFSDLLEREEELEPSVRKEAVERVRTSAAEMRTMVENLLDFSALEAGRMTVSLGPVRVAKAIEVVRRANRVLLADHPLTVAVPQGLLVRADHDGLDRVLRNLVGNAAKFSERGRPITITAGFDEDPSRVRIEVTDEGVGIPDEQLGLVFERLYRAPGASFVSRGTGVGLNMVRRYVELMGGTVSVRSTVGEGSTFTVVLSAG